MWWVLFFFMAGMLLILAEFIVPGGICGIIGGLMIIGSCVAGVMVYPEKAAWIITGELMGAAICIALGFFVISKTGAGKMLVLTGTKDFEENWVSDVSDERLVGREGTAFTALRPAGMILIDDQKVNAVSNGDFIDKGAAVRVLEVHGNRVVVETVA